MNKKTSPFRQFVLEHITNDLKETAREILIEEMGGFISLLPPDLLEETLLEGALLTVKTYSNKMGLHLILDELTQHIENKLILLKCKTVNN